MSDRWPPAGGARPSPSHQHRPGHRGTGRSARLYEIVLREAIATQYGLTQPDRFDFHTCEGCGQPYLLAGIWQPISEGGVLACPRCGAEVASWEGARGYVAYWHRDQALRERRRPPTELPGAAAAAR